MSEINLWHIFHTYSNIAQKGLVEPLRCASDGTVLVTRLMGDEDIPALWCGVCGTVIRPGTELIGGVKNAVSEHLGMDIKELDQKMGRL